MTRKLGLHRGLQGLGFANTFVLLWDTIEQQYHIGAPLLMETTVYLAQGPGHPRVSLFSANAGMGGAVAVACMDDAGSR